MRYSLSVEITSPTNGTSYAGPTDISIFAAVQSSNDIPAFATFYDNSQVLGVVSNFVILDPGPGFPRGGRGYLFDWTNQSLGSHELTAGVTDTNGDVALSAPVSVTVGSSNSVSIEIVNPANSQVFTQPVNVAIDAAVLDTGSNIAYVTFTATEPPAQFILELGSVSNWVSINPPHVDYIKVWSNAPAGHWWVTATAFLTGGATGGSATVQFQVTNSSTITNYPPVVRITSPPNHSAFRAPINLDLLAYASDPGGFATSVQFFAGSNSLGYGRQLTNPVAEPMSTNPAPPSPINLSNLYELTWSNPPAGADILTAVATGKSGATATSSPVNVAILPPPPPSTNFPDIVGIVATDPIAIVGTNCWPWLGGPVTWSNWMSPDAVWSWFTNCGPKDATFTIYQHGDTNIDLNVQYTIGGTASNGVDYVELPGNVTVPAGQTEAMITVVPIDDGSPDINATVVLKLQPDTNAPVNYVVGFPALAEAIILDTMGPQPPSMPLGAVLPDGSFHVSLSGPDGAWFHIDYSTDLLSWMPLCTNQVVNGSIDFLDPDAVNSPSRMYRAVPLAGPPSN